MPRLSPFSSFRSTAAARRAARAAREAADAAAVERQLRQLVAALPTLAAFNAWVDTFPAAFQADIRQRFLPFCTFPRATDHDHAGH